MSWWPTFLKTISMHIGRVNLAALSNLKRERAWRIEQISIFCKRYLRSLFEDTWNFLSALHRVRCKREPLKIAAIWLIKLNADAYLFFDQADDGQPRLACFNYLHLPCSMAITKYAELNPLESPNTKHRTHSVELEMSNSQHRTRSTEIEASNSKFWTRTIELEAQ